MIWPLSSSGALPLTSPLCASVTMNIFQFLQGHLAISYLCVRSHCRHHLPRKLCLTYQVWAWFSFLVFPQHPETSIANPPLHLERMNWVPLEVCDMVRGSSGYDSLGD